MAAKTVVMGAWFDLPRLGTETWSALVRKQGVSYDKSMGFKFDSATDVPAAVATLRSAGVDVELVLRCFVCGRPACEGCPYLPTCDRTAVSSYCLCAEHAPERAPFDRYAQAFDSSLRT